MSTKNTELKSPLYSSNGKIITFNEPLIMAIVNITPDSFYDGGKYGHLDDVLFDIEEKLKTGAQIIDIGAASSRPGSDLISIESEWERLSAFLPGIRRRFPDLLISVDTWRAEIAKRSAQEGADLINDIGGGQLDSQMFETIAKLQIPYVLMHIQGNPQTMQVAPHYTDVVNEVRSFLSDSIVQLNTLGFDKIILDPGFGFGKTLQHNFQLMKHLDAFTDLGYPVLAGISRKGMINQIIGTSPVTALNGTSVLNTVALLNGALLLRVHDVLEAKQAIQLMNYYKQIR
jgi:dihydropteroate synthase